MTVLKNARWERFAQELAKGSSQTDAYKGAGYVVATAKSAHEAASRLARNIKVAGRVEELKDRGAERAELSIANVTKRLVRIADKGEAKNDAPGLSVARLAMMDVAKLQGWLRDRHEITGRNGEPLQVVISPTDARL